MGNNGSVRPFQSLKNVPIIGQGVTATIHQAKPTIVVQCTCGNGTPMLISDWLDVAKCTACDAAFGLIELTFDRQTSNVQVRVAKLTPIAPPDAGGGAVTP